MSAMRPSTRSPPPVVTLWPSSFTPTLAGCGCSSLPASGVASGAFSSAIDSSPGYWAPRARNPLLSCNFGTPITPCHQTHPTRGGRTRGRRRSAPLELRSALFAEGGDALAGVLARVGDHHRHLHIDQRGLERGVERLLHHHLGQPHRERRLGGQRLAHVQRTRLEPLVGH